MKFQLIIVFAFVFTANEIFCQNEAILALKELRRKTLPDVYDKDMSPKLGEDSPVMVGITLHLITYKMNLIEKELYTDIYFRQKWTDSRLQHSYPGVKVLGGQSLADRIWIPDTFFPSASVVKQLKYPTPNVFVMISPEGEVLYSQRLQSTIGCLSDRPLCKLAIESYGYSMKEIDYMAGKGQLNSTSVGVSETPVPGFPKVDIRINHKVESLSTYNYTQLEVNIEFKKLNDINNNEIIENTTNQTK